MVGSRSRCWDSPQLRHETYEIQQLLGEGAYAPVYRAARHDATTDQLVRPARAPFQNLLHPVLHPSFCDETRERGDRGMTASCARMHVGGEGSGPVGQVTCAVKTHEPPSQWEFVMTRRICARLPVEHLRSICFAQSLHVYSDAVCPRPARPPPPSLPRASRAVAPG